MLPSTFSTLKETPNVKSPNVIELRTIGNNNGMNEFVPDKIPAKTNIETRPTKLIGIESLIHAIRGKQVMIDSDLAVLYGVETKVFYQAVMAAADSPAAARQQLKEATASGLVERVRRGLYISNAARFAGEGVDPYEVVTALDAEAILSYHSALEAHGVSHNVGFECHFRTELVRSPFTFRSISYIPHPADKVLSQKVCGKAFGTILVTTREQTVFDCLKHPEWSGGIEEVVRSLSQMPYLDVERVASLVLADSASMAARVGWLLEAKSDAWRVPKDVIDRPHKASANTVSKLDKKAKTTRDWSKS